MLSLGRKEKQSLFIIPNLDVNPDMTIAELFKDGCIEIHLHEINRNQVKIGIDAPLELNIVRGEMINK